MKVSPIERVVYAGTFDPITNGHMDIIERAAKVFPVLTVAVARSTSKNTMFTTEERVQLAKDAVQAIDSTIEIVEFGGLLVNFVHSIGARTIIRGLRAVSDYEYEAHMALTNRRLAEDIETIYLMTSENCSFISATTVREIALLGGDISQFVPACVLPKMQAVLDKKRQ